MRKLSAWDEEYTHDETNVFLSNLALHLFDGFPQGSSCFEAHRTYITSCIATGNYRSLCDISIDYSDPSWSSAELTLLRQVLAFYSKRENLEIGEDKKGNAWSTFMLAEDKCRETNDLFHAWEAGKFRFSSAIESVLFRAQRKISQVLGDCPDLSDLALRFGPGANPGITKRAASVRRKLSEQPTCSTNLTPYVDDVLAELPMYTSLHATSSRVDADGDVWEAVSVLVVDSKVAFVPKSPKTCRTICVEPLLNSMAQLAYGDFISARLLRWGVDLQDQTRNQRLAREGSLTNALATLDLSSASDTIALGLVRHLLSYEWYNTLCKYRTMYCTAPDGSRFRFEKFSSMGNGFTFPLESLIFWALATCAADDEVSVYGDDIVCPSTSYDFVVEVLNACGFTVNLSKSYWSGPFRESCGSDYYRGIDIRPCYIKNNIAGFDLFRLHNFFSRRGECENASWVLDWIPKHLRLFGPDGFGDGHLLGGPLPEPHRRSMGWGGYVFDTFTFKGRRDFRPAPGDSVLPFYTIYRRAVEPAIPKFFVRQQNNIHVVQQHPMNDGNGRLDILLDPLPSRDGVKGVSLPGTRGYKRISIYTLNR